MSHFTKSLRPPKTFTTAEANALLDASGKSAATLRDHMIFSLAFGLGLRIHEIAALEMGDLFTPGGQVRHRVKLRVFKGDGEGVPPQEILMVEGVACKLRAYRKRKEAACEALEADAPLFSGRRVGTHLCERHMRRILKQWLATAGVDEDLSFHELRHTALSTFQARNKDTVQTQRFARHRDVRTTMRYLHASDQGMLDALRGQIC